MSLLRHFLGCLARVRPAPVIQGRPITFNSDGTIGKPVAVFVDRNGHRFQLGQAAYGPGAEPPGGHKPEIIVEGDCVEVETDRRQLKL